ncbi:hypothetical protein IH601_03475 [Candidatus Bipolaricaulota bacterium]|nr:hypothetical protein [Candidatus Bipolaricaulota bacterium]TFH11713.1 MAG: hypothetical protein E4H08_00665 [Candidatus Atribacteria bacterium]
MSTWQKALVARVLLVSCLFFWGCFFSAPINITGTWTGTMEWTSGPAAGFVYSFSMSLLHEDKEVTGTVTLPSHAGSTFEIPIIQGGARSVNMSLIARGPNPLVPSQPTVEFDIDGQFDQTTMSGEGTQSIDGTAYAFEWEAILVTEPVPASLY